MRSPILPPAQPKLKRKRRRSAILGLLGFAFAAGVALFLVGAAAVGYFLWQASKDLPSYERLAEYEPPVMTRIHAHDGSMIKEYARERRIFVPINTVPKLVTAAFVSAEDKRFYEHNGLDFIGIGRAAMKFAEAKLTGRGSIQGASTITQQVAKNMLLSSERTFDRKIREAILYVPCLCAVFLEGRINHVYSLLSLFKGNLISPILGVPVAPPNSEKMTVLLF